MSTAFFIYTISLLVLCVLASSVCLSAYFVTHRKSFIYAVALFLFYLFDVALIFQSEFLSQNLAYDATQFYAIEDPYMKIVLSAGFLGSLWLIVCDYLDRKSMSLIWVPVALFIAISLSIYWFAPEGPFQQFAFYSTRQMFMAFVACYIIIYYVRSDDSVERTRMLRQKKPFVVFCVLIICIITEDALAILILSPSIYSPDFPLYLSERNFSENILLVLFAAYAIRAASQTLALRFEKPPLRQDATVQKHIDEQLDTYCKRHNLSAREGEVLSLILIGKDNQNIASEMQLALGTIKAHVHNILHKTGQSAREDLIQDFWKS